MFLSSVLIKQTGRQARRTERCLNPVGTGICSDDDDENKETRRLRRKHFKDFWVESIWDCGSHGPVFTGRFMNVFYSRITKVQSLKTVSIHRVCPFRAELNGSHSSSSY